MSDEALKISNVKNDPVTISLDEPPSQGELIVSYHTLNGNKPNKNGNYIGIWESDDGDAPPNTPAKFSKILEYDDTSYKGWLVSFPLETKAYVLGYCLTGDPADLKGGDAYKRVCASTPIPAVYKASDVPGGSTISLNIESHGPNYKVLYAALNNMDCANRCWIGIWKSSEIIGNTSPLFHTLIKGDGSEGNVVLPAQTLVRGSKYKLGFFADGYDGAKKLPVSYNSLASLLTFQTD